MIAPATTKIMKFMKFVNRFYSNNLLHALLMYTILKLIFYPTIRELKLAHKATIVIRNTTKAWTTYRNSIDQCVDGSNGIVQKI